MRIAICDDEKSMGQILKEKVKKLLPDAVVEKYLSGDDLISSGCKPDILFLDTTLPWKLPVQTEFCGSDGRMNCLKTKQML